MVSRGSVALVLIAAALGIAGIPAARADPPRSGYEYMTPQVRAMQDDDALNPAMLWVAEGESLWNAPAGASAKSCASCHGDAAASMKGVAARYPSFDDATGRPLDLRQRIQQCRVRHQQAAPLQAGGEDLLSLETYVARQSRGLPIVPPADARLAPYRERGARWFHERMGQLDLSCAQCHDERAGQRLGGSTIPQAHPTGYPIYRLEWQGMGDLARRIHGCMTGVRAEPFGAGSAELVELELYLAQRAAGLKVDAPGVRP
jgi:sulfur-oxidizing protein SoxA